MKLSLAQCLPHADLSKLSAAWGRETSDAALAYWQDRAMTFNTETGEIRSRDGFLARFIDWSEQDAARYAGDLDAAFQAAFLPSIANSCSRLARGLSA